MPTRFQKCRFRVGIAFLVDLYIEPGWDVCQLGSINAGSGLAWFCLMDPHMDTGWDVCQLGVQNAGKSWHGFFVGSL